MVRHWWPVLKRTVAEFREDNLTDWAAALTYYAVLAIFPALIVLVSILGLVGESATQPLIDNLGTVAPGPAKEIFTSAIENLQGDQGAAGVLFVIGLLGALWSASGYVAAFMRASNAIYDIEEGRPIWKTLPVRVSLTLVLLMLLAISTIAVVLTGGLAEKVGDLVGLGSTAVDVWNIAKWPVLLVVVSFMFALLYWAAPNVKHPGFRWISPGGVLAVVGWLIASGAFALLRLELRLVQQDLRRARRRGRVPRLALDLEHHDPARRRVQRGARARARDRGGHAPAGQGAVRGAARHAQDGAPGERSSEEEEGPYSGYAEPEERPPFAAYATFALVFNGALAGAVAAAKRSGRDLPERVELQDLVLIGAASYKLSRLVAKKKITSFVRAPFTELQGKGGPAELEEKARGQRTAASGRRAARSARTASGCGRRAGSTLAFCSRRARRASPHRCSRR